MKLLATLIVALAAFVAVPAAAEAHTMSCSDAYRALGRWRSTRNVAWHGCKGVGGARLTLIVLGRSGRVYTYRVRHYDDHCWLGTLCDRHYVFSSAT